MLHSRKKRKQIFNVFIYVALFVYLLLALSPIYWMVLTSLRTQKQIYSREAMLVPQNLTLENYTFALTERPLLRWLGNSFIVAAGSSFISLVISAMAGYALARLRFAGRGSLARLLVYTYLIPTSLLFIPIFVIVGGLGLLDSRTGLILVYLSFTVPFGSWLLLGFFLTIPQELEDAAKIDGCSYFGVLFRVVLPLAKPGIAATFIFCFAEAWNEFLYAAVLLTNETQITAPLGLLRFRIADNFLWGPLTAAALLTSIPAVVLFIIAQKLVVRGLTAGAVKG